MYSCPTDDIHSIYLDNELPADFAKEYLSHIETCEKCKAKLESLRGLKTAFKTDSNSIKLDQQFLDQSFERLQTKMRYKKNAVVVHQFPVSEKTLRWGMGAAAAVLIAAVLPFSISNAVKSTDINNSNVASITPVTRSQNEPIARQNVVINGNLDRTMAHTVSTRGSTYSSLTDVDVLRPEFDDARKIRVNISVPGLDNGEQTIEIKLPENFNEGQLEWTHHRR